MSKVWLCLDVCLREREISVFRKSSSDAFFMLARENFPETPSAFGYLFHSLIIFTSKEQFLHGVTIFCVLSLVFLADHKPLKASNKAFFPESQVIQKGDLQHRINTCLHDGKQCHSEMCRIFASSSEYPFH